VQRLISRPRSRSSFRPARSASSLATWFSPPS
jgi:hypothetical protein